MSEELYGGDSFSAGENDEAESTEELAEASENAAEEQSDKSISSDLIRGHINTIILRSLYDGDKYGYEILAEIEKKSHGQYSLKQPSLYSALKRLEREGYITSYWGGSVGGGRRKYFSLTDAGKEMSERNQSEWEYSRTVIDSLISDKAFDFEKPAPTAVDMRVLKRSTSRVPSREEQDDFEAFEFADSSRQSEEAEELARRRAELEAERTRAEEDLRMREEALRLSEEERGRREEELVERERRLQEELVEREKRLQEELLAREQRLQEEEARARESAALSEQAQAERERAALAEERARYEHILRMREDELAAQHARELAAQEQRIRQEDEQYFRERTQQIIHQNYMNLVNTPPAAEKPAEGSYYPAEPTPPREQVPDERESSRGYRSVIRKLFSGTAVPPPVAEENAYADVKAEESAPTERTMRTLYAERAPRPADRPTDPPAEYTAERPADRPITRPAEPSARISEAKPLGRIDFHDLETCAARDGIKISTSGGQKEKEKAHESEVLFNKGKALFFSAIAVFLFCVAVGSVSLGFQKSLELPVFYPYFIWGTALAFLLITALAFVNHYGERSLRHSDNVLINAIVAYALCVIVILIIALAAKIEFSNLSQLVTFVVIPAVYFFGVIVFGIAYYLQIRPKKEG